MYTQHLSLWMVVEEETTTCHISTSLCCQCVIFKLFWDPFVLLNACNLVSYFMIDEVQIIATDMNLRKVIEQRLTRRIEVCDCVVSRRLGVARKRPAIRRRSAAPKTIQQPLFTFNPSARVGDYPISTNRWVWGKVATYPLELKKKNLRLALMILPCGHINNQFLVIIT